MFSDSSNNFMQHAIEQAHFALKHSEVPIGAVIVYNNKIIAEGHNLTLLTSDPTAHAEMIVLRAAAILLGNARLVDCSLYVTLEPCPMCAQAISFARIDKLYYGATDFKGGGVENGARIFNQSSCFHIPDIYGGIKENECSALLKNFFKSLR